MHVGVALSDRAKRRARSLMLCEQCFLHYRLLVPLMSARAIACCHTSPEMAVSNTCVRALADGVASRVGDSPSIKCHDALGTPVRFVAHVVSYSCVGELELQVLKKSRRALVAVDVQTDGCDRVASDVQGQGFVLQLASSHFFSLCMLC